MEGGGCRRRSDKAPSVGQTKDTTTSKREEGRKDTETRQLHKKRGGRQQTEEVKTREKERLYSMCTLEGEEKRLPA